MDSILASVKKLLGVPEGCDDFNQDIIIYINSVFMFLSQMGVGPKLLFRFLTKVHHGPIFPPISTP